jgi:uncharacterized protein (TIGR02145 family)
LAFSGKTYNTVQIGTQCWLKENLDTRTYRNGEPIPQVTNSTQWADLTSGAYCNFSNDSSTGVKYGKLYNWYAVNDPRGLAPQNWHVPAIEEWATLVNYAGGDSIAGENLKRQILCTGKL